VLSQRHAVVKCWMFVEYEARHDKGTNSDPDPVGQRKRENETNPTLETWCSFPCPWNLLSISYHSRLQTQGVLVSELLKMGGIGGCKKSPANWSGFFTWAEA
jgi:hypothetical protein